MSIVTVIGEPVTDTSEPGDVTTERAVFISEGGA